MSPPEVAVVIPTRGRETRLAFALEALAAQTLRDPFEVVVVRDVEERGPRVAAPDGVELRELELPRAAGVAAKREAGWRASEAGLVAFTDDDCRPAPGWLEALVGAARAGGAAGDTFVQGRTDVDPDELHLLFGLARSQRVTRPSPWFETCNIAYPRPLLERLGGFDPAFSMGGEDTDLGLRATVAGARRVYAEDALVWHAVHAPPTAVGARARWTTTPLILARHPEQRRHLFLRAFRTRSHAAVLLALAGPLLTRRRRLALAMAIPWIAINTRPGDLRPRRAVRHALHLPARALVDAAETAATIRAAIRQRVPMA